MAYNEKYGITPQTILKSREDILATRSILDIRQKLPDAYIEPDEKAVAADPVVAYASEDQLVKMIKETERKMKAAAKELDFITAAQLRDELLALKKQLKNKFGPA